MEESVKIQTLLTDDITDLRKFMIFEVSIINISSTLPSYSSITEPKWISEPVEQSMVTSQEAKNKQLQKQQKIKGKILLTLMEDIKLSSLLLLFLLLHSPAGIPVTPHTHMETARRSRAQTKESMSVWFGFSPKTSENNTIASITAEHTESQVGRCGRVSPRPPFL